MTSILIRLLFVAVILSAHACPRGSFSAPGSSECTLCPPGTYQHLTNATSCIPCPAGAYLSFHGGQAPNACQNCPGGTFSPAASASCTPCPEGTISTFGSDQCVRCPKGTALSPFPSFGTPSEYCETCYDGYADEPNLLECKPCPPGSSAPPASTSIRQCQRCPFGTVSNGRNECSPCGAGSFATPDASACTSCPLGFQAVQSSGGTGGTECVLCQPGQYATVSEFFLGANPECHTCPEGTTTYTRGARFCRKLNGPCPKGFLQTSSGDCVRCNVDERYHAQLQRCVPCAQDEGSVGGLPLQCAPCTEVVKAGIQTSKCAIGKLGSMNLKLPDENGTCSAGYRIKEKPFGRFCEACEVGSFSAQPNSIECLPCPSGTIAEYGGAHRCERCPDGTIAHRNRDRCFDPLTGCPPGNYLNVDSTGYTLCVRDECSIRGGLRSCPPCTGSYYETYSFAGCTACPGNQVRNMDFTCGCVGPFAQNIGIINGSCSQCPPGSYGKRTGPAENKCVQCPAGTYREVKTVQELMAMCPRCGNARPCLKCPAGFVTRRDGATACERCPEGTFTYGIGDSECLRFGAPSAPVSFNDALDQNVIRERERLEEWL